MALQHKLLCLLKESREDGNKYEKVLGEKGFSVISIPVLSFNFVNKSEILFCLQNPLNYSGLIFTSQRAVESVKHALEIAQTEWKEKLQTQWNQLAIFAIGKSTSALTSTLLELKTTGEDSENAENLLAVIKQVITSTDKPLLFPCGNLKKETIPKGLALAGIACKIITAYNTIVHPDFECNLRQLVETKGIPECFIFFSPSGVKFFHKIFQNLISPVEVMKFIAIGPSTEEALNKVGYSVAATATHPTPDSLSEAISAIM